MGLGQPDASVLRRFEHFCALEGFTCDAALHDAHVVESFLAIEGAGLAPHSLGTYRSTLRRMGSAPRTARPFPASSAPAPYGEGDLAALWSRATNQGSERRIANATVLIAASVGAGLRPRELAHLCGCDVVRSSARVSVRTGTPRRLVPVDEPYASMLLGLSRARASYLFRPGATVRGTKNLVGEIAAQLVGDLDEVALSSGRCRSTFLCRHLARDTPLRELCTMAGLIDVESLLRYARHVKGAPQTKAQLRARARR